MTTTNMGAIDLMNTRYIPSKRNFDESLTSSAILSTVTTLMMNMQVAKAATGIIREFVRKSKKSRISIPKMCTKDSPL